MGHWVTTHRDATRGDATWHDAPGDAPGERNDKLAAPPQMDQRRWGDRLKTIQRGTTQQPRAAGGIVTPAARGVPLVARGRP
jgi:hypothetical protein